MNKGIKLLLSMMLALTLVQTFSSDKVISDVKADETYPMGCGNFEVAYVSDQGGFSTIGCYNSFDEAKNEMYSKGSDAVVRHGASKSPTKIIAMVSGVAASYSYRRGTGSANERTADLTMNIQQYASSTAKEKETYVTSHREMNYKGTYSYNASSGTGRVNVNLTGFDGYANLDQVDLIPAKFLAQGMRILLGGNTDGAPWEAPFWVTPKQSHYEIVQNGNYKEIVYRVWSYWADKSGNPQDYSTTIGPAESWMPAGTIYYTNDMHQLFTDRYFSNQVKLADGSVAKYYNYYEFLPLRSRSKINGDQLNAYLNNKGYTQDAPSYENLQKNQSKMVNQGWSFTNAQDTYGVNALLVYSMGLLESGWGRSSIAIKKNNLFGWGAVDSNPSGGAEGYDNIAAAVQQHMAVNLRGYLDIQDARFFGSHLGNKGSGFNVKYASDPYWGLKIAGLAYQIDKYVSGNNGSLTDYGTYTLGVVNEYNADVKRSPDNGSATLYKTAYGATYQNDFMVIAQSNSNGWIGVPTTNGVRSDGSLVPHKGNGYEAYNWDLSVGYLPSSKVSILGVTNGGDTPVGEFAQKIESLTITGTNMSISGYAFQPGIYVTSPDSLKHYLVMTNSAGVEVSAYPLNQTTYADANYAAAGFSGTNIPVQYLLENKDTYSLSIRTVHSAYNQTKRIAADTKLPEKGHDLVYDYVFASDANGVTLTKKDRVIEESYLTLLDNFAMKDAKTLTIKGKAYVLGRNQANAQQAIHQLLIQRIDTGETVKTVDLTSYTGDVGDANLNMGYDHPFDYSYGYYKGDIDISTLPMGDYSFTIKTIADGKEFTRTIYGFSSQKDSGTFKINDTTYGELKRQYEFSNRYELNIRNFNIELNAAKTKLPRIRESYQYLYKVGFDEASSVLTFKGTGFIWNGTFSAEKNPKFTLYLINKTTGEIISSESNGLTALTGGDGSWSNTDQINDGHDYGHTWYEAQFSLAQLKDGDYSMKLKIETDDYVDLLDVKNRATLKLPSVDKDGKKLSITMNTKNKSKVELSVKGFYVPIMSNSLPQPTASPTVIPSATPTTTPVATVTPETGVTATPSVEPTASTTPAVSTATE